MTPINLQATPQRRAAVRQMEAVVKRSEARRKALCQKIRSLRTEPALSVQINALSKLVVDYVRDPENRDDDYSLHRLFQEILVGSPDQESMAIIAPLTDHDLGHLCTDFMHLPHHLRADGLTKNEEKTLYQIIKNAFPYFHFRNYPERIMLVLARQSAGLQPQYEAVDLFRSASMAGLSCAWHSVLPGHDMVVEACDPAKSSDAHFTGVLLSLEAGLAVKTIEPYLNALLFNLFENALPDLLWKEHGAKMIVSIHSHEIYSDTAVIEVSDNGPIIDPQTISDHVLEKIRFSGGGTLHLGLPQALLLANQLQWRFVAGGDHAGNFPFFQGNHFMILMPNHL
ncbi:MAG: hypothetical protein WCT39_01285 [Candidatus Margulisiibacteriota bacterium]